MRAPNAELQCGLHFTTRCARKQRWAIVPASIRKYTIAMRTRKRSHLCAEEMYRKIHTTVYMHTYVYIHMYICLHK